ncbi:MAG: hypothetical protein KGY45_02200 [Hadesarchaea archaeon]|nr:hypothetical protein [Hadesarchaea archaeon]
MRYYPKIIIGVILAIIGSVLAFFKGLTPDALLDYALIVLGVALIGVYCIVSWEEFRSIFGKDASLVLFVPPLLTFGILSIYLSQTSKWLVPPHDTVLIGLGIALIAIPLVLLGMSLKNELA